MDNNKYKVIAVTNGNDRRQGGLFQAEFTSFKEAQDYRSINNELGNLRIKLPDGSWWPTDYKVVE